MVFPHTNIRCTSGFTELRGGSSIELPGPSQGISRLVQMGPSPPPGLGAPGPWCLANARKGMGLMSAEMSVKLAVTLTQGDTL